MKWVKLSSKMMQLKFMPCEPWYIESRCHGACCRSSVHKDGISVVIHPKETDNPNEYAGKPLKDGFIVAENKRCPFQMKLGLCKLHPGPRGVTAFIETPLGTPSEKPFGCVTSPFTLNHNDTLIVRNRYKLLTCFRDAKIGQDKALPAYINFYPSLERLFGMMTSRRIREHFDRNGNDMTMRLARPMYDMLKDNDNARKS